MKAFVVLFSVVCFVAFVHCYKQVRSSEWTKYKIQHGKVYESSSEEQKRMNLWMMTKKAVEEHNKLYEAGEESYAQAVNMFADMTESEKELYTGVEQEELSESFQKFVTIKPSKPLEDEFDWRDRGAVTPVKNQGQCGSCYSFSVTGALEGQHFRRTGKLVSLSEQQIVDCSKQHGCNGGWMPSVFKYIASAGGLDTEESYPYETNVGTCRFSKNAIGATDGGFSQLKPDEENLKAAVASIGPISVCIKVLQTFMNYKKDIYYDINCNGGCTHAVLVVGYGTEGGQDYWLVKNSWGTYWGLNGYIKMARNRNNQCGIATWATYPTSVGSDLTQEVSVESRNHIRSESIAFDFKMNITRNN